MVLDDRLTSLQHIAKTKLETEQAISLFEGELQRYRELIEEKLPRIIDNIVTMGSFVLELGEFYFEDIMIQKNTTKRYRAGSNLRRSTNHGIDFYIVFDEDSYVQDIGLLEQRLYRRHWYSFKEMGWVPIISAKTSDGFTEDYIKLAMPPLERSGGFVLIKLPLILSEIPEIIKRVYERVKWNEERKLGELKSRNGEVESLSVPNFP